MKAMILAAGLGTRMRPLTDTTPKPLLKVQGKPLIQHLIEKLADAGITDLVINHSYLGDQIEQALGDGSEFGVNIEYSSEKSILGTGGGIVKALPLLGENSFILVNSDIWTNFSFEELSPLTGDDQLAHLVLVDNASHNPEGDFVLSDNGLLSWPETAKEDALTYSGIAVFHPDFFKDAPGTTFNLLPLLKTAMLKNQATGESFQGEWIDVGTPERLAAISVSSISPVE